VPKTKKLLRLNLKSRWNLPSLRLNCLSAFKNSRSNLGLLITILPLKATSLDLELLNLSNLRTGMLLRAKLTLIIISMVKAYLYQLLTGRSMKVTGRPTRKTEEEGLSTQQLGLVTKESLSITKNNGSEVISGPVARSTRAILTLIR